MGGSESWTIRSHRDVGVWALIGEKRKSRFADRSAELLGFSPRETFSTTTGGAEKRVDENGLNGTGGGENRMSRRVGSYHQATGDFLDHVRDRRRGGGRGGVGGRFFGEHKGGRVKPTERLGERERPRLSISNIVAAFWRAGVNQEDSAAKRPRHIYI